jgi:hypothetical protein
MLAGCSEGLDCLSCWMMSRSCGWRLRRYIVRDHHLHLQSRPSRKTPILLIAALRRVRYCRIHSLPSLDGPTDSRCSVLLRQIVGYGGLIPSSYDESRFTPAATDVCAYPAQGSAWVAVCPADMRTCREVLASEHMKQFVGIAQASWLNEQHSRK